MLIFLNNIIGANGVLLVYDITNRQSFDELNIWMDIINKNCHPSVCKILVGNKLDQHASRQVPAIEGAAKARELNMIFHEVSAKGNAGVVEAYLDLITSTLDESPTGLLNLTQHYRKEEKEQVQKLLCSCCT